jgi:hypothetical protein
MPCPAGELPEERALLFSKQETVPDLKKEMLNKKRKTKEHNFRKILRKKSPFRSILPEDMQLKDVHNLRQEENSSPLAINYACFKKKERKKILILNFPAYMLPGVHALCSNLATIYLRF